MAFLLQEDGSFLLNEDGTKILLDEDEELADPVDLITANPDPANPSTFASQADLYVTQFKASIPQLNTAFTALRLVSVSDVSATSNSITQGQKTFTVSAGKSFLPGQYLTIADTAAPSANSMVVQVESYSGTTLAVKTVNIKGSGTKTSWTISLAAPMPSPYAGISILSLHTGNGHGTTNTKIRRMTTVVTNTGQDVDWVYTDSATDGASVTFLESGIYMVNYLDLDNSSSYGISVNSTQLTTIFESINEAHKRLVIYLGGASGVGNGVCTYMSAGDVMRMHTDGTITNTAGLNRLRLERVL